MEQKKKKIKPLLMVILNFKKHWKSCETWSTGGGCDIEQRVMQTINTPKIMRGVETGELRLIGEN